MKRFRPLTTILLSISFLGTVFAADPDVFSVTVNNNTQGTPIKVGEAVDLEIKALLADGTVVKDYDGTIFIEIKSPTNDTIVNDDYYEVPSYGVYEFKSQDLGTKLFSKGLLFKKEGTYVVHVSALEPESLLGKVTVIVGQEPEDKKDSFVAQITSPTSGSIVTEPSINVFGQSDVKRAPVQIYVGGKKIDKESETDASGNFSFYITDIASGSNSVQIKLVDFQGTTIGESDIVNFAYNPLTGDNYFKTLTIGPSNKVKAGEPVTFTVTTNEQVANVELSVGDIGPIILDKINSTSFSKEVLIDTEGELPVSINLVLQGGERRSYPNRDLLEVEGNVAVQNIKVSRDSLNTSSVTLTRESIGSAPRYKVSYGTDRDNPSESQTVSTTTLALNNLSPTNTYYFRVQALDSAGDAIGEESTVVVLSANSNNAGNEGGSTASCVVGAIRLTNEKVGNNYFLVRDVISGATNYSIYKADFATDNISSMQKVGDSTTNRFQYPFDPYAEENQYAYYAVQATCSDGKTVQLGGVRKIQVGPETDILYILIVSFFVYSLYKLYKYSIQ